MPDLPRGRPGKGAAGQDRDRDINETTVLKKEKDQLKTKMIQTDRNLQENGKQAEKDKKRQDQNEKDLRSDSQRYRPLEEQDEKDEEWHAVVDFKLE